MTKVNNKSKTLVLTCAIIAASSSAAMGAALAPNLHSASGLGTSHAGAAAGAHDVSDMFTNPAIISQIDGNEFSASVNYLMVDAEANASEATRLTLPSSPGPATGSATDNAGEDAIIPAFYYSSPINDKVSVGVNLNVPFGLATKYHDNWWGRSFAQLSSLETRNLNPVISYNIDNKLSIAAGAQVQRIDVAFTQESLVGFNYRFEGDDWGYGYTLGALYDYSDDINFGIGYRSKIEHKVKGKGSSSGISVDSDNTSAGLTLPEILTFGGSYQLNDNLQLLADAKWTRWSRMQDVNLIPQGGSAFLTGVVPFRLEDSWQTSVGTNYRLNDAVLLRGGLAYEQSAVKNSDTRLPALPTTDRTWLTIGGQYSINKDLDFDIAYLRQFFNESSSTNLQDANGQTLTATYDVEATVLSAGVTYRW